jgi:Zn-dependent peptidase ImmA (M78 family)
MRFNEIKSDQQTKEHFIKMFSRFLPLAMKYIGINSLPKMVFMTDIDSEDQPTFGQYVNNEHVLYIALSNRHPVDILRTVAHELTHYRQDLRGELQDDSGRTGSPQENQAHAVAGVVMRQFNKKYPEYLGSKPIVF